MKWISVKKRLPKRNQKVLHVYSGVGGYGISTFWIDIDDNPRFGMVNVDGHGSIPTTHWMPLPKMPR